MPLGSADEYDPADADDHGQLSFPFRVQRVPRPPEPNRYSLAPTDDECPEGGGFFYENCPAVFLGRFGYGPLRVAWDTNILIDYAEYGDLIWRDGDSEFDPPIEEPRYRAELIAFDTLMQLWMMRDIRIRVFPRQIFDAQRAMDADQWELREVQLHHILASLTCIQLDKEVLGAVRPFEALDEDSTSAEWDASLVQEAIENGCHVFLTRDGGLRRRVSRSARESCMAIMSPAELQRALAAAGELGWGGAGYVFPDNHKWLHLMKATGQGEDFQGM